LIDHDTSFGAAQISSAAIGRFLAWRESLVALSLCFLLFVDEQQAANANETTTSEATGAGLTPGALYSNAVTTKTAHAYLSTEKTDHFSGIPRWIYGSVSGVRKPLTARPIIAFVSSVNISRS